MKKIFFSIILSAFMVIACTPQQAQRPSESSAKTDQQVACQKDLRVCLDGTKLSRTPPECEFPVCPESSITYRRINTSDIEGLVGPFTFSAEVPAGWEVEAVPQIEALNFYDPTAEGETNLDKSQIFVRHFQANDFLTLSTVTIFTQTSTTTLGRPTVVYDIEKKAGVADFPSQPAWRNERHFVTDIREADDNPTTFYVFGQRPDLGKEIFEHFLYSLEFKTQKTVTILSYDVGRVTKKSYGTFVTPENSPVQPERFRGYHTGIDVEYGDITEDVVVTALTNGTAVRSGYVSGYGGMVALRHTVDGQEYVTVYGHLDPDTMVASGTQVQAGDRLGVLGEGYSDETDNERKHLHLSSHKGSTIEIRGYVQTEAELTAWTDPVKLFNL